MLLSPLSVARRRANLTPPKEIFSRVSSVEAVGGPSKTSTCTCRSSSTKPLLASPAALLKLLEPSPDVEVTLTFKEPASKVRSEGLRSVEIVSSVAGLILALSESLTPTTPVVGELPSIKAWAFLAERSWEAMRAAPETPAAFKKLRLPRSLTPLEVAAPRSSGLPPEAGARLLTGLTLGCSESVDATD